MLIFKEENKTKFILHIFLYTFLPFIDTVCSCKSNLIHSLWKMPGHLIYYRYMVYIIFAL